MGLRVRQEDGKKPDIFPAGSHWLSAVFMHKTYHLSL